MSESISGKTILITGSTDGLGKLVGHHLALQNATIILHGRNEEKGKDVLKELQRTTSSKKIKYYNGDFSSLEAVRDLSDKLLKENERIDILINNVGIGRGKDRNQRELSKDGIELRFAVNYLAHVLLTEKLLPILNHNGSKIINVASIGQETINFKNLMLEHDYEGFFAYRQSKTALIMYTFDLASRLNGNSVKVNAVHPSSLMNTKMVIEDWGRFQSTVEEGAEAVENLLFADTTGEYYDVKKISRAIPQAYNREARALLRSVTKEMLEGYLPFPL